MNFDILTTSCIVLCGYLIINMIPQTDAERSEIVDKANRTALAFIMPYMYKLIPQVNIYDMLTRNKR